MHYAGRYENSLHFSPLFQQYAGELADHLINRYGLRNKDIVEIGCGNGEFLSLLVEAGANRGVGFDPSAPAEDASESLRFVRRAFGPQDADHPADLVCCRQVLEHIQDPLAMITELRQTIGSRTETAVFFEVPDFAFALRTMAMWDIVYEHCSYFGPASLYQVFVNGGFDVLDLRSYYGDTFIGIEAKPRVPGRTVLDPPDTTGAALAAIGEFRDRWPAKLETWKARLEQVIASGQSAVLWGAGARAVSFVNMLPARPPIDVVVDLNPRKHGWYLAGGGQEIVPPEHLIDHPPDLVILTNGMYREEIRRSLEDMGLRPEIEVA